MLLIFKMLPFCFELLTYLITNPVDRESYYSDKKPLQISLIKHKSCGNVWIWINYMPLTEWTPKSPEPALPKLLFLHSTFFLGLSGTSSSDHALYEGNSRCSWAHSIRPTTCPVHLHHLSSHQYTSCNTTASRFAPFPQLLLDGWDFCRPTTQATPSVSPVQDSAVSEHLQFMPPIKNECTDTSKDKLKTHPLPFH